MVLLGELSNLESVASDLVVQCISTAVSQVEGMSAANVARVASDLVVQCVSAAVSQVDLMSDINVASNAQNTHHSSKASS